MELDDSTAVEITALAVASAATVLALWSLGWHLLSRQRFRSRLKVSDGHGVVLGGAGGGEYVVIVRAENTGSLPVGVMGWGFRVKRGRILIPTESLPASPDVPLVLRPGEDASFFVPMREFERAARTMGASSARPFVTVAARTVVSARRRARLVDGASVVPEGGGRDLDRERVRGSSSSGAPGS